jgi:hypothetical protein
MKTNPVSTLLTCASLLLAGAFDVFAQTKIPASYAAPAGSVDTATSGFKVKVVQGPATPTFVNSVARAEAQLAGTFIDPGTGLSVVDEAIPGPNPDGTYDQEVINFEQTGANAGNLNPSDLIPGIPGAGGHTDNIAMEAAAMLELKAGRHRFGVNSDDGFRFTLGVGANPKDAFAIQLGVFDGGRGAANTEFEFDVEADGIYAARLIWFEGNGGASVELYSQNPPASTGTRILVNNRNNANAVKAYLPPPVTKPFAQLVSPTPNAVNVPPDGTIRVELVDQATKVEPSTIKLTYDGIPATPNISQAGGVTTIVFRPAAALSPGSVHSVNLFFTDNGSPATTFDNTWQFTVANYQTIPEADAYPIGSADTSAPGFKVRVVQAAATPVLPNSQARAEAQLAGLLINPATGQPYDNEAVPGPNADSTYNDADVINYEQDAGAAGSQGNFQPDEAMPGIPGTTGHTDNIAMEILTYLELPAGAHTFGVNSDDGFAVFTAPDARDVFATRLGIFDGGRGAADTIFSFVAADQGLYSFRLVWYEGTGGANLEWFSIDPATGAKILINDRNNAKAVKAWRQTTAPTRPYVKSVTPRPGARVVPVNSVLEIKLADGGIAVDQSSIQLQFEGSVVSPTIKKEAGITTLTFDPPGDLKGTTTFTARLTYSDTATPAHTLTHDFTFETERPPTDPRAYRQSEEGLVVAEAEDFHAITATATHAWVFDKTPAGWSADGVMYALPETGAVIALPAAITDSPRLDFKVFFVKTGTHYFWFRGSDGGGDSLHAGIDDVDPSGTTTDNMDEPDCCGTRLVPGGTTLPWINGTTTAPEGRATLEVLTPGEHVIHLWMREDGQIVDKFLMTTDVNFIPTGKGPPASIRVGDPIPPIVSISAPADGAAFAKGAPVTITADARDVDGAIAKVEFFAGADKIGEDTSAPFSIEAQFDQDRPYTLTAKATDNSGLTTTSGPVKIVVGNPRKALFVVSAVPPGQGDPPIVTHLEKRGFLVTLVDDNVSDPSDADGKDLIVISSTVGSGNVADKYTAIAVPILNWESFLFDDLLMAAVGNDVEYGTITGQTDIKIVHADHPLAAGLPAGPVPVYNSPENMTFGLAVTPNPTASIVARSNDGTDRPVLWAYEKDALLIDGVSKAAARRVGFFLSNNTPPLLNEAGYKLFDAAVNWALNIVVEPPPKLTILAQGANIVISWTGGGALEEATVVTGPWTSVLNATTPHTAAVTGQARFFRVRR